jgi:hypothetical protein
VTIVAPERAHVHVWVHVATTDWMGRPCIACKCVCGDSLTPEQIAAMRLEAGVV